MLIAVEGGDGVGKTTFATQLLDALPGLTEVKHFSPPKIDSIFTEYECFDAYTPGGGRDIVCDRLHLGELIYGPLYRDKSLLDSAGLLHVELYLRAKGCLLVHMDARDTVVYERLWGEGARGEDFLQKMHVQTVLSNYRKRVSRSLLRTLKYTDTAPANPEWTIAHARRAERAAARVAPFKSYIGYELPHLLLLGEKKGSLHLGDHAAAFVPYASTSGHYMLTGLAEAGITRIGIANALEEDLPALAAALGYPPIVALGRHADRAATKAGLRHGTVPHPQYIRRFHHPMRAEYIATIVRAADTGGDLGSWPKS